MVLMAYNIEGNPFFHLRLKNITRQQKVVLGALKVSKGHYLLLRTPKNTGEGWKPFFTIGANVKCATNLRP